MLSQTTPLLHDDDASPEFNLEVTIEFTLSSNWDETHPPFCHAWLADDLARVVSKKTLLKKTDIKKNEGEGFTVVMEMGVLKVYRAYRYLLIDFHKQYNHEKASSFQPGLGHLKINLNDVIKAACLTDENKAACTKDEKLKPNQYPLSFWRDGVPITCVITLGARVKDAKMAEEEEMKSYETAIHDHGFRKEWCEGLLGHLLGTEAIHDHSFMKIWSDGLLGHLVGTTGLKWLLPAKFVEFFERSQEIADDGIHALLRERWMRGKLDNFVAGPALALALQSLIGVLVAYTAFTYFFGNMLLPSCVYLNESEIAKVPKVLYLVFFAFAIWKLRAAMLMMAAVLPLRVSIAGFPGQADKGPSHEGPSHKRYLISKIFHDFLSSFEIFSASLFLARIRATRVLSQSSANVWNMESAWHFALSESESLASLFNWLGWYPTFLQLSMLSWTTFFLQILYSLAYSVPTSWEIQDSSRPPQPVAYDFREGKEVHVEEKNHEFVFVSDDLESESHQNDEEPDSEKIRRRYGVKANKDLKKQDSADSVSSNQSRAYRHCVAACGPCVKACLMMQTVVGLFYTRPKTNLIQMSKVKAEDKSEWVAFSDYSTYTALLCEEQTHAQALSAVAKTGRFTLAQTMETAYRNMAIKHWKPHEILQVQRQQNSAFVVFMLQKLFNISIQASLAGISANLSVANGADKGADPLTVFTVLVSCCLGVSSVRTAILSSTDMSNMVLEGVDKKLLAEGASKWRMHHEYVIARTTRQSWMFTILFSSWCLSFLLWCTVKTLMSWYCQCGMWNFTWNMFFPSSWGKQIEMGCVSFGHHNGTDSLGCRFSDDYVVQHFMPKHVNFIDVQGTGACFLLGR